MTIGLTGTQPRIRALVLALAFALGLGLVAATTQGAAAPARAESDLPALPLRTSGNQIVAADGRPVILQGVNWFGMETAAHAPHGLWSRDYRDMLAQIAGLGFNTIRLPFSLAALRSTATSGIDYGGGRNEELQGRTPRQVMDAVITAAGDYGLMIILDNHSQADDGFMYDLWYGQDGFTETDWVNTWKDLARRYRDTKNVIGFDLKNEPHGSATWGDGKATDWRRAAERAGNAALAIAPNKLILVEGIEGPAPGQQLDRHWWGGNLEGAASHPVRLSVGNRLVYSPHEYGPGVHDQPWFSDPNMADILTQRWDTGFGYLHDSNTAPILIGEFGAKNVGTDTTEGRWIRQFANYLADKGMHWTYWSWNPNSGDTGGILTDDWTTTHPDKTALLQDLMKRAKVNPGTGGNPGSGKNPDGTSGSPGNGPAAGSPGKVSRAKLKVTRKRGKTKYVLVARAPKSVGTSAVTGYQFRLRSKVDGNKSPWQSWRSMKFGTENGKARKTLNRLRKLPSGSKVKVQVRAVNSVGPGAKVPVKRRIR